jgi:2-phospho-L-lactate/phosphoenolpyruvate guanylyltransferase
MTLAIVPVKRFDRAKSRLAELFSPSERRDLACAMLADVLDTLARAKGLTGVLVVTSEAEAQAMAASLGFETVEDEEAGLNAAASLGLIRAAARDQKALIAPGDIPFLAVSEVRHILKALERAPVVLAPAARDGGTNLLAMARADLMPPSFGPDSAARHAAMARARGIEPAVLRLPGAGRDIDVPADLRDLRDKGAPRMRAFLAQTRPPAGPCPLGVCERTSP